MSDVDIIIHQDTDFIHVLARLAEMNLALSIVVTSVIIPDSHNHYTPHHERVIVRVSDPFQVKRMEVTAVLLPEADQSVSQIIHCRQFQVLPFLYIGEQRTCAFVG